MGANQNSSQKLGLYPEIDPTPLSFNSVSETAAKTRNGTSKITYEIDDKNRL
jgi:hypothetical protein